MAEAAARRLAGLGPTRQLLPYLALVAAIVGLSFSPILIRWAGAPGAVSGFYRMLIAAALLAAPAAGQMRRRAPLSRRHVALAVLGGLFFAADLTAWNAGVLLTSAGNAALLGNTSPIWVGLGALVLFREKLRPIFWAGLLLALAGAAVILGGDFLAHPSLGMGDLLSLLGGFFYSGFFLASQRARESLSAFVSWWISSAASTLALLAFSLALGQPLLGYSLATYVCLAAMALVTQIGGFMAIQYALGRLPASLVSPSLLIQPVMTALLAIPLLGERLGGPQIAGGLAVLAGVWLIHKRV